MPEIILNVTVEQMQRLYNVLDNWEQVQTKLLVLTYGISEDLLQDRVLVQNFKNRLQQEIDNNT